MKFQTLIQLVGSLAAISFSNSTPDNKFISIVGSSEAPQSTTVSPLATTAVPNNGHTVTKTFLTTITYPNGGPTIIIQTKTTLFSPTSSSPAPLCTSAPCPSISTIYTTGFEGLILLTSTSTTRYLSTSELANGAFTVVPITSTTTLTQAFSGVPRVSYSTYVVGSRTTVTATAVVDGVLTTLTQTDVALATTSVALRVNGAVRRGEGVDVMVAVGVVAALGWWL
jgi:hypothetical protein